MVAGVGPGREAAVTFEIEQVEPTIDVTPTSQQSQA